MSDMVVAGQGRLIYPRAQKSVFLIIFNGGGKRKNAGGAYRDSSLFQLGKTEGATGSLPARVKSRRRLDFRTS
jgi:hypothetical protein